MKTFLCKTSQLGSCYGFELAPGANSLSGFLVRDREHIRAYQNCCPHTGIELNWLAHQFLDLNDEYIQCATHGALFRLSDGRCIAGPCVGQSLTALAISIEEDEIYLHSHEAL